MFLAVPPTAAPVERVFSQASWKSLARRLVERTSLPENAEPVGAITHTRTKVAVQYVELGVYRTDNNYNDYHKHTISHNYESSTMYLIIR